jgi:hypothetical protein
MTKMKATSPCLFLLLASAGMAFSVDLKGDFTVEARPSLHDGDLLFNQEYGSLGFQQQVDDNLFATAKIGLRYYDDPAGSGSRDGLLSPRELGILSSIEPLEVSLDEAYFTYSNFIVSRLDLTVGKQRIPWGTADKLNPTDLLNPLDFSDPLDFGKKIPSLAVLLAYTLPSDAASFQLVFEPYSQVARLSPLMLDETEDGLDAAVLKLLAGMGGLGDASEGWTGTAETPAANLSSSLFAAKASTRLSGVDLSASFVSRMNDLPYVKSVSLTSSGPAVDEKSYTLGYYREYAAGMDASADLGFMLAWAEASLVFPGERHGTSVYVNSIPVETTASVSAEPYLKYTVGFDKTFGGGLYLNVQYNHGFFNERGNDGPERLQDYLAARLELSLLDDTLKLGWSGLGNLNNTYRAFADSDPFGYIGDNWGFMGGFDVEYKPDLSLSIKTGVMLFDAKDSSSLAAYRDMDLFFVKAEYHF